jgi:penicillin-binding protein 1A
VRVGNDDSSPMDKVTGGKLPARIWTEFMRVALKNIHWAPLPRT